MPKIDKILIFSHDTRVGGANINLLRLLNTLCGLYKIEITTLTLYQDNLYKDFLSYGPVHIIEVPLNDKNSATHTGKPLLRELAGRGYRHVIANTVISGILTEAFQRYGMTVVSLVHEMPTLITAMSLTENAKGLALYSDYVVFASQYVHKAFPFLSLIEEKNIKILEQGVYRYRYPGSREEARTALRVRLGLPSSAKIILGCGLGEARKGVDLLPQLMDKLVKRLPDAYFVWLGHIFNPEFRSWVEHDISIIDLTDRFIFLSEFERNPAIFFEGADVFLLSSREDPYPSVVLEAMKAGLPCVSFKGSGGAQQMLEGGRGVLVPYLDMTAMTDALERLLTACASDRAAMTNRAAHFVRPLTYERYASELLCLLHHPTENWPLPAKADISGLEIIPPVSLKKLHCVEFIDNSIVEQWDIVNNSSSSDIFFFTADIASGTVLPETLCLAELPLGTPFAVVLDRMQALAPHCVYIHHGTDDESTWLKDMRLAARILNIPLAEWKSGGSVTCPTVSTPSPDKSEPSPWPFSSLLIVIHSYELGGGEIVARRIANEMSKHCRVFMYNARPEMQDITFFENLSPNVIILPSMGDPTELRRYVEIIDPDIVNSHVWWAEIVTYQAIHDIPIPWILTTHGCHETLLAVPECDPRHAEYGVKVLSRADRVIYVAEKNRTILHTFPEIGAEKYVKMLNGCTVSPYTPRNREELDIAPEDVVFCLVSRAIPEKGWAEGIECVLNVLLSDGSKAHIILVGDGEMRAPLQEQYIDNSQVHFVGLSANPMEWLSIADVGILPSRYIVESQPLVIGEYITMGLPVIATNVGDIPELLMMDGFQTGLVCPLTEDNAIDRMAFTSAMQELATNSALYNTLKKNTQKVASKFSIEASCATVFGDLESLVTAYRKGFGRR